MAKVKSINKSDIINQIAKKHGLPISVSQIALDIFFDTIVKGLKKGHSVQIRGLGSFVLRSYKAYTGKHPKSNKTIQVKSKKVPFFKAGSISKEL